MTLTDIWNTLLYIPLVNLLVLFYHLLGDNLGLAIIFVTLLIKLITYPLGKPVIEAAKKQRELQPEIDKLKKKYKNKQIYAQKQMELFRKNGINPAAGCLPQIVTIIVFLALYRVFLNLLNSNGDTMESLNAILYDFEILEFDPGETLNTIFLWMDLAKPDPYFILPVLAAASQFILSKYTLQKTKKIKPVVKDTPDKSDDLMYNMQEQMAYIFPIMTLVIGVKLPSGLVLYWFVSTLFSVVQYYLVYRKSNDGMSLLPKNDKKSGDSNKLSN